jgi:hypothetical protein
LHNKELSPRTDEILCVGAGAVEFIICHAEIQIAFVEEKKITEVEGSLLSRHLSLACPTINNAFVQFI